MIEICSVRSSAFHGIHSIYSGAVIRGDRQGLFTESSRRQDAAPTCLKRGFTYRRSAAQADFLFFENYPFVQNFIQKNRSTFFR